MKPFMLVVLIIIAFFFLLEKAEACIAREVARKVVVDSILGGDTAFVDVYVEVN